MSHKLEVTKVLEWAAIAGIGGVVRFVAERMKSDVSLSRTKYAVLVVSNGFVSGFSGLMGALLISTLTHDHVLHLFAAGMFGYYGTQGVERLAKYMLSRFKI